MDSQRFVQKSRLALSVLLVLALQALQAQSSAELEALRAGTLERINAIRSMAGLEPVTLDAELSRGAQEHALYLIKNKVDSRADVHTQDQRLPGASAAGFKAAQAAVIMERVPPTDAISFHLSTLFHRLPLVAPGLKTIGIGAAKGDPWVWASVIDVQSGLQSSRWKEAVWVPGNRGTNIPTTFGLARPGLVVHESPNPLGNDLSAGYPITVSFPAGTRIADVNFVLTGPGGPLPLYVFWPEKPPAGVGPEYMMHSAAAIPQDPLSINTRYRAVLQAMVNGKPYEAAIEFTTGDNAKLPGPEGKPSTEPLYAYWFEASPDSDLWGLMDETGRTLLEPRFSSVDHFREKRAAVNEGGEVSITGRVSGGKWGLVDTRGTVLLEPKFDELTAFSEGKAGFRQGKLWGYIDLSGKISITPSYESGRVFSEGMAAVKKNKLWGFLDAAGKEVIPLAYTQAGSFSEGKAAVELNGRWGYINKKGKFIISPAFDQAWPFSEGFAPVRVGAFWGLVDEAGKIAIKPEWDAVFPPSGGRVVVGKGGLQGLSDLTGRLILEPAYRSIGVMSEGRALVENSKLMQGYIDADGKLISGWFLHAQPFSEGRAAVADTKHAGFIGLDGRWIIENPSWSYIENYEGPLALVFLKRMDQVISTDGRVLWHGGINSLSFNSLGQGMLAYNGNAGQSGFINLDGNAVMEKVPYALKAFSEGLAPIRDDKSRWGYIDAKGSVVIVPRFDEAEKFGDGLAPVKLGKLWGYVDKTGRMAIEARYDFASPFLNSRAVVRTNGLMGVIDRNGKEIIPLGSHSVSIRGGKAAEAGWFVVREGGKAGFMNDSGSWVIKPTFDAARNFTEGLSAVMADGKWGYADPQGRIALSAQFQEAWPFSGGLARVKKDGNYGYIDKTGKTIIPFLFRDGREAFAGFVWLAEGNGDFPPRWGLADFFGAWVIPPMFDEVLETWPGRASVRFKDEGPSAYINREGKIIRQW